MCSIVYNICSYENSYKYITSTTYTHGYIYTHKKISEQLANYVHIYIYPTVCTCAKNKNPRSPLERPMSQVIMTMDTTVMNIPAKLCEIEASYIATMYMWCFSSLDPTTCIASSQPILYYMLQLINLQNKINKIISDALQC